MENCFRFLINIDQCMNMSYFDIFFYKLESQHKFHMSNARLFGNWETDSLRSAVTDIRMYLDKYPYHVGDYQIIVAMRSDFREGALSWEETMLCRLLWLDYELCRAHILINSREQTEKALNLIMLYDADFSVQLSELPSYKESGRLRNDCVRLLERIGLSDGEPEQEKLEQAVAAYREDPQHDAAAAELLQAFAKKRRRAQEQLQQISTYIEPTEEGAQRRASLSGELAEYVRDCLFNVQLFEQQIDRNNRRQQTLALLRVVEFVNMSTQPPVGVVDQPAMVPLAHRCAANWQKIWQDRELEQRYADMLHNYRSRLGSAARELENSPFLESAATRLPEENIPEEHAITCEDGIFSDKDPGKQKNNLKSMMKQVLERKFSLRTIGKDWSTAYTSCKQLLEQMEYALKNYAESLSRQYAAALEQRKKDSAAWRKGVYISTAETESDISRLDYERDQRLQKLKTPRMNPSLNFQDQLNMENSLEQGNLIVQHYIRCLNALTAGNFLLLIGACALLCFAHYTFLQPYVFQQMQTVACYLAYLAAILVLWLLCWVFPYNYFKKKLKACIGQFKLDAETYINGYYTKAEQFESYINLLNQLDYITRYSRLLTRAYTTTHKLSQGYLWHKVQIQQHLTKLHFFQGLIELGNPHAQKDTGSFLPAVNGSQVSDYIDSQIYWPQS